MPDAPAVPRPRATTLHLVRHAQTLWDEQGRMHGGQDSPLTSAGRYRASLLAADLHEEPLEAVYAGPGGRAQATAQILVAGRGLGIETRFDLREMDIGPWEGRRKEDLAQEDPERYRAFWQQPDRYDPQGGESFTEVRERMRACVDGLIRAHRGGSILIVSYGVALQALLASIAGRPLRELGNVPDPRPCSHSIVRAASLEQARILRYAGIPWPPRSAKVTSPRVATTPA